MLCVYLFSLGSKLVIDVGAKCVPLYRVYCENIAVA